MPKDVPCTALLQYLRFMLGRFAAVLIGAGLRMWNERRLARAYTARQRELRTSKLRDLSIRLQGSGSLSGGDKMKNE